MPFISIITTTYKHQDFIAQTIESILSQSFTDWELLIGDDSPDNPTWEIIQEYVQKYPDKIKAWHHSPNKGIVGNMNFLLEQMNPESQYVAFLEGDDIFTPNNLEEKMKFFELFPEKNFVYTGWSKIDAEGMVIEKDACKKFYQNLSLAEMIDIQKNFIHSFGCVAFKKGILNKIFPLVSPNKEKMFGNLDYFTWLKLLPIIHFGYIQENLLFYRIHTNNFS